VIYNDCYDHRQYIAGLCNAGLAGLLFTPEARGAGDGESWLRRLQAVCLSPLAMINAWADGTKPWSFPEVEDEVRDVMLLRIRLLPYLYTAFAHYCFEGVPPVRPMILEPAFRLPDASFEQGALDSTDNPYNDAMRREILDQFMLGPDLLVAPLFAGEAERTIVLRSCHCSLAGSMSPKVPCRWCCNTMA
jgi:alpha-D-xyloside xylohydrolase